MKLTGFLLSVSFIVLFTTGLIKFPEFNWIFSGIYLFVNAGLISRIHDGFGLITGFLFLFLMFLRSDLSANFFGEKNE